MKLESSASVGFIHKESVTMHSHAIVKLSKSVMPLSVTVIVEVELLS